MRWRWLPSRGIGIGGIPVSFLPVGIRVKQAKGERAISPCYCTALSCSGLSSKNDDFGGETIRGV